MTKQEILSGESKGEGRVVINGNALVLIGRNNISNTVHCSCYKTLNYNYLF